MKFVPLAPPAAADFAQLSLSSDSNGGLNRIQRHQFVGCSSSVKTRLERSHGRKHSETPLSHRSRRATLNDSGSTSRSIDSDDSQQFFKPYLSTDDTLEDRTGRDENLTLGGNLHRTSLQSNIQYSLGVISALLLHINEILPEYCNHLSTSANLSKSSGASKAINVLEKGAAALSSPKLHDQHITSGRHAWNQSNPTIFGSNSSNTFSPSRFLKLSSKVLSFRNGFSRTDNDNGNNVSFQNLKQFLSPPRKRYDDSVSIERNTLQSVSSRSAPSSPQTNQVFFRQGTNYNTPSAAAAPSNLNVIASSEWERFVSPFLMLIGAEVLYGRMEHVIDPKSEAKFAEEAVLRQNNCDDTTEKETMFRDSRNVQHAQLCPKFLFNHVSNCIKDHCLNSADNEITNSTIGDRSIQYNSNERKSPVFSLVTKHFSPVRILGAKDIEQNERNHLHFAQSHDLPSDEVRRGSHRLFDMYRQIRSNLIIVGEYLCDPFLGRSNGEEWIKECRESNKSKCQFSDVPVLPLQSYEKPISEWSSSSGTNIADNIDSLVDSGIVVNDPSHESLHQLAAISLRESLDSLISFIDARCILIHVHADLCYPMTLQPPPTLVPIEDTEALKRNMSSSRRWIDLSKQCNSIVSSINSRQMTDSSMTKFLMARLEREVKIFGLAMDLVCALADREFFNCVLNARKLYVLIGSKPSKLDIEYLPLMWIRSFFEGALSLMRVYFPEIDNSVGIFSKSPAPNPPFVHVSSTSHQQNRKCQGESEKSSNLKSSNLERNNVDALVSDFILLHQSVSVAVVHKTQLQNNTYSKSEVSLDDCSNVTSTKRTAWTPLYIRSTFEGSDITKVDKADSSPMKSSIPQLSHEPNLIRMIRKSLSHDDSNDNLGKELPPEKTMNETRWPLVAWTQIEHCLDAYSKRNHLGNAIYVLPPDLSKAKPEDENSVVFTDSDNHDDVGATKKHKHSVPQSMGYCHITSVTEKILLVITQSCDVHRQHDKKRKLSNEEISVFMRMIVAKLSPENLFNINSILRVKAKMSDTIRVQKAGYLKSSVSHTRFPLSLWNESGWADNQRNNILSTLGLRKNSPIIPPLKSPYIRRQIENTGQKRRKKFKSAMNNGHFALFLGIELSQCM